MSPLAYAALAGVGDMSKEFLEYTGYGFHVRRRLTSNEQLAIGDAVDCRGTEEGLLRFEKAKSIIPTRAIEIARQELGMPRIILG